MPMHPNDLFGSTTVKASRIFLSLFFCFQHLFAPFCYFKFHHVFTFSLIHVLVLFYFELTHDAIGIVRSALAILRSLLCTQVHPKWVWSALRRTPISVNNLFHLCQRWQGNLFHMYAVGANNLFHLCHEWPAKLTCSTYARETFERFDSRFDLYVET